MSELEKVDIEYSEKIKECSFDDTESGHIKADDILCEMLLKLGYSKTVEEFKKLRKWYA
mgnify:CR=1 FL=1